MDLIDRQDAVRIVDNIDTWQAGWRDNAIESLKALPPVQPERKTGRWIDGQCSNCGCDTPAYIIDWKWQKDMDANYCPNCGAYMGGDESV